jgi:hypothetical protein
MEPATNLDATTLIMLTNGLRGLLNDNFDNDRYLVEFCCLLSGFPDMIRIIQLPIHFQDHSACPTNPSDPNSPLTQAWLDDIMDTHNELYHTALSLEAQYITDRAEVARLRSKLREKSLPCHWERICSKIQAVLCAQTCFQWLSD